MSKELVVCATRNETRVAVLEDDQLVEIYFQREKEYSLAGSIHKGRVTRVLPGMQSAFVDIGLDRDAFLYVSDFFEDNEEYDKIVTSVEEKVLRMEKGTTIPAAIEPAAAAPAASAPIPSSPPAEPEVPKIETAPAAPPQVANGEPAPPPSAEGRDNRNRQGRRSRRRRPRGRGLPESKFYSPRTHPEPQPAQAAESEDNEGEFPVLPGESLAKYGTRS